MSLILEDGFLRMQNGQIPTASLSSVVSLQDYVFLYTKLTLAHHSLISPFITGLLEIHFTSELLIWSTGMDGCSANQQTQSI